MCQHFHSYGLCHEQSPAREHLYMVSSPFNGDKKENTTYRQISLSLSLSVYVCVCVCLSVCTGSYDYIKGTRDIVGRSTDRESMAACYSPHMLVTYSL